MTLPMFGLILFSVTLNSLAQVFLRRGMAGMAAPDLANVLGVASSIALNPWFWGGMACYGVSILSWLFVLSKLQVSVAYPFLSIGYVIAAVIGFFFLGEAVGPQRIIGIALICSGLVFISRSA
jgi:multidrug transporter EmrE-like cation transporter